MEAKGERTMTRADRIVADTAILVGKPCVKGTRLSVDFLLGLLAQGWSEAEVLRNYPGLTHEDVLACLEYASELVGQEKVFPYKVA
jgi:uncharacterized protein (DUF433 family)